MIGCPNLLRGGKEQDEHVPVPFDTVKIMPNYHVDKISRLEDIESLLVTAQGLAVRLTDPELDEARRCIRCALEEVRDAKNVLTEKWQQEDEG